jgi:hypothetical protein
MSDDHPPQPREIVVDALVALNGFTFSDTDTILMLLGAWGRRDELSVADIRAILRHYRARPGTERAPSAPLPILPATLRERDPAPAGAVRGRDNDGDDWTPTDDGQWCYEPNGMIRGVRRLVRMYGPIDWYDADGALLAVSHKADL